MVMLKHGEDKVSHTNKKIFLLITPDLVKISIAVMKHHDWKQLGEVNVHFTLHAPITAIMRGSQGGNSK